MKQKTDQNLKNRSQKYCELHGKCNHTTSQCKVIQKQLEEYKNCPNDKNNKNQKNEQHRYNTRSNTKKNCEENNTLSLKNQSDEASSTGSEVNHIEEIFQVQDTNKTHNSNEINTEVQVQCHGKHTNHFMLGLLDTGATDFCGSRHITVCAYVEDNSIGRHDIVLGLRFIKQLGLIFDFARCAVTWNDITIPMRQNGIIHPEELSPIDMQDIEAPEILQHATRRMERHITSN
jgi:hypothetical protein